MRDVKTVFDTLVTRCPRLGGAVPFDYCRKVGDGLPCAKSLICWETMFPVGQYMRSVLNEDEWQAAFHRPPKNRLDVILKLAQQAPDPPSGSSDAR